MSSRAAWLAAVASVAILLLGVRAFLDPVAASVGFGLPMHTDTETTFAIVSLSLWRSTRSPSSD